MQSAMPASPVPSGVERRTRGGTASEIPETRTRNSSATQPPGRTWTRVGDFLTGNFNSSQGIWSATGGRRQYPLTPVAPDRFIDSLHHMRHGPTGFAGNSTDEQLHTHLSSRIPRRVWYFLAKTLGIKLSRTDKPVFATVLNVLTLAAALTFAIPGAWYTFYDIHSRYSKTTVLIGCVQIIIGFGWACLGVYSNNLAARLFSNKNFVDCVRVHSKTFMKISVSWLTLILGVLVIAVNCYEASPIFYDDTCGTAEIEIVVCQVFYVGRAVYAVLTIFWNFIVVYVLFSVCRTHTIGIRRFMKELTLDARVYENYCLRQYNIQRNVGPEGNPLEESWMMWDDPSQQDGDDDPVFLQSFHSYVNRRRRFSTYRRLHSQSSDTPSRSASLAGGVVDGGGSIVEDAAAAVPGVGVGIMEDARGEDEEAVRASQEARLEGGFVINGDDAPAERLSEADGGRDQFVDLNDNERLQGPNVMTNEDLLFSYWKFLRRLCVTSRFLQRWLASWIAFVLIWNGYFIIYWTSHSANLSGIAQFVIPLLVLLLVCSAYAEVNAEGQRLLKTICPTEERLAILFYFNSQPLTVRVFSFVVTYNAIVTVVLGFSVAFASRMILDEISRD